MLNRFRRIAVVFSAAVLWGGLSGSLWAQTNQFQGFQPGDIVRVKCDKPLVVLSQALFEGQTATNIAVMCKGDRYTFDKANVTLSVPEGLLSRPTSPRPEAPASAVPASAAVAPLKQQDLQSQMLLVQQALLGKYASDPGYGKATSYYQETMKGFLDGKVSMSDLVTQAEATLKKVDEYGPERAKDPQFEEQISQLKDFVRRARSGEKVETAQPRVE